MKRSRAEMEAAVSTVEEVDTIAIRNYKEKGVDVEELHAWFTERSGFMILHAYERIQTVFVKFESQRHAAVAIQEANEAGLGAEWAYRNLRVSGADPRSRYELDTDTRGKAQPRLDQQGRAIDTLAILAFSEKNLDEDLLRDFFSRLPGFITIQTNKMIHALFVKFDSPESADVALKAANEAGYGAEWARRNLEM